MWTINWKAVSPSKPTFSDLVSQVRPHIWKIQQSFKIMALLGTNCSKMWALGEITAPNHSYKWFFRSYVICTHMCMYTFYTLYMHTIHIPYICMYIHIFFSSLLFGLGPSIFYVSSFLVWISALIRDYLYVISKACVTLQDITGFQSDTLSYWWTGAKLVLWPQCNRSNGWAVAYCINII